MAQGATKAVSSGSQAQMEDPGRPAVSPERFCVEDAAPLEAAKRLRGMADKPKLTLPLPLRQTFLPDHLFECSPTAGGPAILQPVSARVGPYGIGSRRAPAVLRSRRQVPARLQALDDQTVMPRDVY